MLSKIDQNVVNKYVQLFDFDPENDPTPEEFRESMEKLTVEQLIEETSTDEHFTLEEYMDRYM
jgi:hypothetical protein